MIRIDSTEKLDKLLEQAKQSAKHTHEWMRCAPDDPIELMYCLKFEPVGLHPITHHKINLIEQVNQFWTYVTALTAARELLRIHPEIGDLTLAPGAHAAQKFDIMSREKNMLAAEVFAAVDPSNNSKLRNDIEKLASDKSLHRFVFFMSPEWRHMERHEKYELGGVQVWSIAPFRNSTSRGSKQASELSDLKLLVPSLRTSQDALVQPNVSSFLSVRSDINGGAGSPLQHLSFRDSFDPDKIRLATEKFLTDSLVRGLARSGEAANLVLNSIQIARNGQQLIVSASPEVQNLLALGFARIAKSSKFGTRLPQVRDARTGDFIEIMKESRGATALSRVASLSNVMFSAAHLISSYDIAKKLSVIDSKLDLLLEFRRIDQAAALERIFASAKELCALPQSTERDFEIWRLRSELRELRAVWRREVSHHLSSIDDPAQRDFFSRTFSFQSSIDDEIHGKISRGELQMVFLEYALRLDFLMSEASGSRRGFFNGLRDELDELRTVGRLLEDKAAFISIGNREKDPRPTILRLNGIVESYMSFANFAEIP